MNETFLGAVLEWITLITAAVLCARGTVILAARLWATPTLTLLRHAWGYPVGVTTVCIATLTMIPTTWQGETVLALAIGAGLGAVTVDRASTRSNYDQPMRRPPRHLTVVRGPHR